MTLAFHQTSTASSAAHGVFLRSDAMLRKLAATGNNRVLELKRRGPGEICVHGMWRNQSWRRRTKNVTFFHVCLPGTTNPPGGAEKASISTLERTAIARYGHKKSSRCE